MPISKLLVALSILFLSCDNGQVKKQHADAVPTGTVQNKETENSKEVGNEKVAIPADTTSSDYLIYLVKNEIPLTGYWTERLEKLDAFAIPRDSTPRLSVTHDWPINDSVSIIILRYSTNVGNDEFLLTIKNKKYFVAKLQISNQYDADVSKEYPDYFFTEYQLIDDRKIKLLNHEIKNYDTDKEKEIVTNEYWSIQGNGELLKNKIL